MKSIRSIICVCAVICSMMAHAQCIPQALEYTEIYDFIEELATDGVIQSNAAIKPYSRNYIAHLLLQAHQNDSLLNKRQKEDLLPLHSYHLLCAFYELQPDKAIQSPHRK